MDNKLYFKIRTQNGLIIQTMKKYPSKWFLAGDFCGGDKSCPFVGYKAPTRIAEMQKEGLIISRWADRKTELGTKMKEYKLNEAQFDFFIRDWASDIKVYKKQEAEQGSLL